MINKLIKYLKKLVEPEKVKRSDYTTEYGYQMKISKGIYTTKCTDRYKKD